MNPSQASEGKRMWQREQGYFILKTSHNFQPLRGAIPPTSANDN
jgi:hypothetical protein